MKTVIALFLVCGLQLAAQEMQSCPMHEEHMKAAVKHQADMEKHSDESMGFPHDKTAHHFRVYSDGGAIEVTINDSRDSQDLQAVRAHLRQIAAMFAEGDFSMFAGKVPPGVNEMKDKRVLISYSFDELPDGGRVRIKTGNHDVLNAIHDFLSFQISDRQTADTSDIVKR
jgi:hypothetical protein